MSPMIEISAGQAREVLKWVTTKKPFSGADVAELGEEKNVVISIVGGEEPLVIYHDKIFDKRTLVCSDNHAREIKKAGIVLDFPKTPEKKSEQPTAISPPEGALS